jgi:branched-chain amino acid transport system substrate-binding protein
MSRIAASAGGGVAQQQSAAGQAGGAAGDGSVAGGGGSSGSGGAAALGGATAGAGGSTGGPSLSGGATGAAGAGANTSAAGGAASQAAGKAGTAAGGTSSGHACTGTEAPVTIGSLAEASGLIGQNLAASVPAIAAWTQYMNQAQGGLACHHIKLVQSDTQSDPGRASSAVQDMASRGAVAFVANFVPLSISGMTSADDPLKIPAIGGDLFAPPWWVDPVLYPVGTGLSASGVGTMGLGAKRGNTKVAVVYCIEASACPQFFNAIKSHAAQEGAAVVYSANVTLTATDFTAVCQNAKNAGATQISIIMDGSGVARLGRSCSAIGYNVPFYIASLGIGWSTSDPNLRSRSVSLANAVAPWFPSGNNPGQALFLREMAQYAPQLPLNGAAILAWADGMMLKAAVDRLGDAAYSKPLTAAMVRQGLAMVKGETLNGLVAPTTFNPAGGPNAENPCYFPVIFGHDGTYTGPLGAGFECV